MGNYTNKDFMDLKDRYIKHLTFIYNKNLNTASDKDFSKKMQSAAHAILTEIPYDEFSQSIVTSFKLQYTLGLGINEIIFNLKDIQKDYLRLHPKVLDVKFKNEYYRILGINTNHLKRKTIYGANGEIVSQNEYDYDFSFKNLNKLRKAKTEQEKLDIYFNEIEIVKQTAIHTNPITIQLIDAEELSDFIWFKALVKLQGRNEFSEFLEGENDSHNIKKAKQTSSNSQKVKKIVTWTNGKNKNDFVKIIYALHGAKLINSGKGEITKIVENLAPIFDVDLKDWQSNFSSGINNQTIDYNHTAIFEKLQDAYLEHVKTKIKNAED